MWVWKHVLKKWSIMVDYSGANTADGDTTIFVCFNV